MDGDNYCLLRGGGEVRFSNKNWEGEYNFYLNFFFLGGGFRFETLHFFENHRPTPSPGT